MLSQTYTLLLMCKSAKTFGLPPRQRSLQPSFKLTDLQEVSSFVSLRRYSRLASCFFGSMLASLERCTLHTCCTRHFRAAQMNTSDLGKNCRVHLGDSNEGSNKSPATVMTHDVSKRPDDPFHRWRKHHQDCRCVSPSITCQKYVACVHVCVCVCVCVSVSVCLSLSLFLCLSVRPSVRLSVSVLLSFCLFLRPSLPLYLYIYIYISKNDFASECQFFLSLPVLI